jgi:5'-3' exonuclease
LERVFNTIKELQPTKVIFAIDAKPYWRYKYYSEYKGKRKEQRDASAVDFKEFYPIMEEFLSTLKESFSNFYFIKSDNCEADDVVSVLSTKVFKNDSVVIYSNDKDYNQLLKYKNIKRYNPMEKEGNRLVNCLNPELELNQKILIGDTGDNIPNILVLPEKYPHKNPARRIGVGDVMAQSILENGLDSKFVVDKVLKAYPTLSSINNEDNKLLESKVSDKELVIKLVKENFQRNRILIDFEFIPEEYQNRILDSYNKYEIKGFNAKGIYNLLYGNGYIKLYEDYVSKFKGFLVNLK